MVNETFDFFRCPLCGFSGSVTEAEIAKHRSRCAVGSTEGVPAQPSEEKEAEYRRLADRIAERIWILSDPDALKHRVFDEIVRFYAEEKQ
jgi:hypothetical protein